MSNRASQRIDGGSNDLIEWAGGTTTGACHSLADDAFGASIDEGIFVVAHGCGGMGSGRMAADLAVACLLEEAADPEPPPAPGYRVPWREESWPPPEPLARAVLRANRRIYEQAPPGAPGCTLAALRLVPAHATLVHVGDCRIGRMSQALAQPIGEATPLELHWLTNDHALWLEFERAGYDRETVASFSRETQNVVTRMLGPDEGLAVDVQYRPAAAGELFLLCSDGVTAQLEYSTIAGILRREERPLVDRCRHLLEATEQAGGDDNATVILARLR